MKAFFNHYSLNYGLCIGYDLTSDYDEFVKANMDLYTTSEALVFGAEKTSVSEKDIYDLSKGNVLSENATKFKEYLKENALKHKDQPNESLMISMHSGSSDYLLVSKVLKDL